MESKVMGWTHKTITRPNTDLDLGSMIDSAIRLWGEDFEAYRSDKPELNSGDEVRLRQGLPYGLLYVILRNAWYERYTDRTEAEQLAYEHHRRRSN